MKKKTIIASRDEHLRKALEFLFATEPLALIAGSSRNTTELLTLAQTTLPDLILLDWDLDQHVNVDLFTTLQKIKPGIKTIVFSNFDMTAKAHLAGADICITKGSQPDAILKNFRLLFEATTPL